MVNSASAGGAAASRAGPPGGRGGDEPASAGETQPGLSGTRALRKYFVNSASAGAAGRGERASTLREQVQHRDGFGRSGGAGASGTRGETIHSGRHLTTAASANRDIRRKRGAGFGPLEATASRTARESCQRRPCRVRRTTSHRKTELQGAPALQGACHFGGGKPGGQELRTAISGRSTLRRRAARGPTRRM